VSFGNDILSRTPRGGHYKGVSQLQFLPIAAKRNAAIRQAIAAVTKAAIGAGTPLASIGYLTAWGKGVAIICAALQGAGEVKEIKHRVVMDEAEVLLATRVVSLCLEPITDPWRSLATGLELLADLYRARGDVAVVAKLSKASANAAKGQMGGNAKAPKALKLVLDTVPGRLSGDPRADWLTVRRLLESADSEELRRAGQSVLYLMTLNRGRRIADALAEVWQRRGGYFGARILVDSVVTEDQILGADGDLVGINVMTIHKSKGKEFDAVIVMHLGNLSPLSSSSEPFPHPKARRLLRVAVTRARRHALLLTDRFDPSPLLAGHKLKSPYSV
jgi:DNA helicase-2/ATP-dependent DNA helicase PcrA